MSLDGSSFVAIATGSAGGGISSVLSNASQFSGDGNATALTLNSSSVTLQGNTFNAADRLVMLDASARYPALDGSLITGITVGAGAVDTTKLAADAVTTPKLLTGAVTTSKLADDAVTSAKLLDGAVTAAKLAAGALDTSKLAADAVTVSPYLGFGSLDPALDPNSDKLTTSRILMDACIPYEWKEKPVEVKFDEATLEKVKGRWAEYGIG